MTTTFTRNILVIEGHSITIKWLLKKGTWRILWFGLLAKLGWQTVTVQNKHGECLSVGMTVPIPELWEKGYKVRLAGRVFKEPILLYARKRTTIK